MEPPNSAMNDSPSSEASSADATSDARSPTPPKSSLQTPDQQVNFTHPLTIKLDEKNFLLWKRQILATVKGHNLRKFIDPKATRPSRFASSSDRKARKISEAFEVWEQQDQKLLSWMLSSMSESILTLVVDCDHSWQLWQKLEEYFAAHTRARVVLLG